MPMTLTAMMLDTRYSVTNSAVTIISAFPPVARFFKGLSDTLCIMFEFQAAKIVTNEQNTKLALVF